MGPFVNGHHDPDHSLTFWFYNGDKRSVVLDHEQSDERATLDGLLCGADIFVNTFGPRDYEATSLGYEALREMNERLIVLSVTPFGLDGPWSDYRTSDLVGLAAGGMLFSSGYDDHTIPPIRPGGNQGYHVPANFALIGALLALIEREHTGQGQLVDVSMHDTLAVSPELANPFWFYPKVLVQRQTCRHAQPVPTQPALFETSDGRYVYFALILADAKPWGSLVEWLDSKGMAADLGEPEYSQLAHRQKQFEHISGIVEVFFLLNDAATLYHEGQARGLPVGPINAIEDLFEDEHLQARGFFHDVEHADVPAAKYPSFPIRFSAYETPDERRAPSLGEHTQDVLAEWSGDSSTAVSP
jgi:benzylsuccinate CoA-transferase BbsE subunit